MYQLVQCGCRGIVASWGRWGGKPIGQVEWHEVTQNIQETVRYPTRQIHTFPMFQCFTIVPGSWNILKCMTTSAHWLSLFSILNASGNQQSMKYPKCWCLIRSFQTCHLIVCKDITIYWMYILPYQFPLQNKGFFRTVLRHQHVQIQPNWLQLWGVIFTQPHHPNGMGG